MAYKYKITSDYVYRSIDGAAKNLFTHKQLVITGAKGSKCELLDKSIADGATICKINAKIDGTTYESVFIKKKYISLLDEYKFDISCSTNAKCNVYSTSSSSTVEDTLSKNKSVKAKHGSSIADNSVRIQVKYTKNNETVKGWIEGKYLVKSSAKNTTSSKTDSSNKNNTKVTKETKYLINQINRLYSIPNTTASDGYLYDTLGVTRLTGIYGSPYQFMNIVDRRLVDNSGKGTGLGRAFSKYIVADMPLLLLTPGKVKFLTGFSNKSKNNAIKALSNLSNISNVQDALSSLLSSDYSTEDRRYYTFGFDTANYYNYVNPMLWNCAIYLGIGDKKITIGDYTEQLKQFKWQKVATKYGSYLGYNKFVGFYLDSEKSISQSFTNSTTESAIASGLNSISDTAREIKFLTGAAVGKTLKIQDQDAYNDILDSVDKVADKYLNGSSMFKSLSQGALTIASGGRLLFPEVWSDSSFAQSYDISMKLRTPDCDTLSWYLNICVPMCHLISMAAPRQLSGNGYASPFLVRAFYKGLFSIDTGMIDSLSFTKGKESAWNANGLPTEVDVSMSIKDMYNVLFISGLDSANSQRKSDLLQSKYILKNTGMMDYLANLCGVNVTQPELARTLEMYTNLTKADLTSRASRWGERIQNDVMDAIQTLYSSTFGW